MDQTTRNFLQRATQEARRLLEAEFAAQLEGTYDILPDGRILPEPGPHLDDRQRLTRKKILEAIEHGRSKEAGKTTAQAVDDYLREAAFTFLNRFAALKMLESRSLVQQCVSKGEQSSGFKEFSGLAPGLGSLLDKGYQLYLECLFDELGSEIRVLFDRSDPVSLLWPGRQALSELLEILNRETLQDVWDQDETIGWIYQYFNNQEERRAMRDDSSLPRSSREIAVRNQFFTPRYVVEFLSDNTLGRIWYEMRGGDTSLKKRCRYLVRRPTEVFLPEGEPRQELATERKAMSPGELIQLPVHVPFRPKKDPRDLKILDPACGSGHFLLYCFELLITIYLEAWLDPSSPNDSVTGRKLAEDYPTVEALKAAMPGLVLQRNLHGIDIDPRCAQIAALALWMRAQRAFNEFQIGRQDRIAVERTNIVVAEPMPGEKKLLDEFIATELSASPEDKLVAQLVRHVFEEMKLAGEAGSLLKIEDEIAGLIAEAKKQWKSPPRGVQNSLFGDIPPPARQEGFRFEVRGISDAEFWNELESRIYQALAHYSKQAETGSYQRRLFAADAAHGFAFIDVCRQRYDVVLMNPPFGDSSLRVSELLVKTVPLAKKNTYIASIVLGERRLATRGVLGAITDGSFIHQTRYEEFRAFLLARESRKLSCLSANGWGVLGSYVETASLVLNSAPDDAALCIDLRECGDLRNEKLISAIEAVASGTTTSESVVLLSDGFRRMPKSVLTFWLPTPILEAYRTLPPLAPTLVDARCGISSSDNPRFYKLWWEVPQNEISQDKKWVFLSNGGLPAPLFRQQVYVINYKRDGEEIKTRVRELFGSETRTVINQQYYFRGGFTYGKRTESLTVQFLPRGQVFSNEGQAVFPINESLTWHILAYLNTSLVAFLLNSIAGQHKESGYVGSLPSPPKEFLECDWVETHMRENYQALAQRSQAIPESQVFVWPLKGVDLSTSNIFKSAAAHVSQDSLAFANRFLRVDELLEVSLGFSPDTALPWVHRRWDLPTILYGVQGEELERTVTHDFLGYAVGVVFGRWDIRFALNEKLAPELPDPFSPLSVCSPGQLQNKERLPITKGDLVQLKGDGEWNYPFEILWDGILVDDPGHPLDVEGRLQAVLDAIWKDRWESIEHEACETLGVQSLREYFRKPNGFWTDHLNRYSKSRRQAPIYWPLSTSSGNYTMWLYYHRLKRDTLSLALEDYGKPKLRHEQKQLDQLRGEAGPQPTRIQREAIEAQEGLVNELSGFVEELARVAPLWNPDLNDGVSINYAPLWRMINHTQWRQNVKECWDSLVAGDYDWSHLAMHLWPERVVPKGQEDVSLAIAHNIDEVFWEKDNRGRRQKKKPPEGGWGRVIERLVAERSSSAVKSALTSLLEAPPIVGVGGGRRSSVRAAAPRRTSRQKSQPNSEASPTPTRARAAATSLDAETLDRIKDAIGASPGGASKADVLAAAGVTAARWNATINPLLEQGIVTRTGERRGTRYHLAQRNQPNPSDPTDENALGGQT